MAELSGEVREARTATLGVAHLVSLLTGDMRNAFQRVDERLAHLERERA
jgi:hypothetical protein